MKNFQNAHQITGRAIGSFFFAVFGAIWLLLAFFALEHLNFATVFGIASITLGLIIAARALMCQAKYWPQVQENPRVKKLYLTVNVIQYFAIAAVVIAANTLHLVPYLMCGITLVVGLHMLPLARLFKYTPHYVTGAALVAWAITSAVSLPLERMQGYSALGTGMILWVSAVYTLFVSLNRTRQLLNSQAQ